MRHFAGDEVGSLGGRYYKVWYKGGSYLIHRIIWIIHNGWIDNSFFIDHIDGNSTKNSIENLRTVVQKFNNRNSSLGRNNTTVICGVSFVVKKKGLYTYRAAIWREEIDGKSVIMCKHFSVKALGLMVAFRDACEFRSKKNSRVK